MGGVEQYLESVVGGYDGEGLLALSDELATLAFYVEVFVEEPDQLLLRPRVFLVLLVYGFQVFYDGVEVCGLLLGYVEYGFEGFSWVAWGELLWGSWYLDN